jgi:trehalose 6-phosphate phosphatase
MSVPLFDALNEVAARVQAAPHVLLFCDFDGALAPVYDNPAAASLSTEVRPLLADLAASGRVTVTVVSGRSAADLRSRANVPGLIVAGNHGLEIAGPGWDHVDRAVASSAPNVALLTAALARATENIPGVLIEDKRLSASVHFRRVPAEQHEAVRSAVHGVLGGTSHPFVLTTGRMVYDIRPRVYWHKGEAVKWIAGRVRQPEALVIFVGGDPTDEDAFAALPNGVTVRVGPGTETAAKYHLEGPDGVRKFLEWLREQVRPRRTGR